MIDFTCKTKYVYNNHLKNTIHITKLYGHNTHISYVNHNRVDT